MLATLQLWVISIILATEVSDSNEDNPLLMHVSVYPKVEIGSNDVSAEVLPDINSLRNNEEFKQKVIFYRKFPDSQKVIFFFSELLKQNFTECLAILETGATILITSCEHNMEIADYPDITLKFILLNCDLSNLDMLHCFAESDEDKTLLMFFAEQGKNELAKLLISRGANVHFTNSLGYSAQHYAHKSGNNELEEYLATFTQNNINNSQCECCIIL